MDIEEGNNKKRIQKVDYFLGIPDHMWREIASKLPKKSRFRLKCVSKSWYSVLSDEALPSWNLLYRCGSSNAACTESFGLHKIFTDDPHFDCLDLSSQFIRDDQLKRNRPIIVLAVSNGLFLCFKCVRNEVHHFVCNPLTRQWVSLPPKSIGCVDSGIHCTDDGGFKVVRLAQFFSSFSLYLEIFSSDVGEWRTVNLKFSSPIPLRPIIFGGIVFCNGIMHSRVFDNQILAYDLTSKLNKFRLINMPTDKITELEYRLLGVCNGYLRYLLIDEVQLHLYVWTLQDYDAGKWDMEFDIPLSPIIPGPWSYSCHVQALSFHPYDAEIVYMEINHFIVSLNMKTKDLRRVSDRLLHGYRLDSLSVFPFVLPTSPIPLPQMS